jgi:hypothetical protein
MDRKKERKKYIYSFTPNKHSKMLILFHLLEGIFMNCDIRQISTDNSILISYIISRTGGASQKESYISETTLTCSPFLFDACSLSSTLSGSSINLLYIAPDLHNIYAVLQVYVHISVSHLDNEPCEKER